LDLQIKPFPLSRFPAFPLSRFPGFPLSRFPFGSRRSVEPCFRSFQKEAVADGGLILLKKKRILRQSQTSLGVFRCWLAQHQRLFSASGQGNQAFLKRNKTLPALRIQRFA
jgi:hypothetical protein